MFRGFLSGIFWGAIVFAVVLGFVSLLVPLPATVDPQVSAAESTTGSDKESSGDIGTVSEADEAVEEGDSTPVRSPGADDALPLADTESAPQPNPAPAQSDMSAPDSGESAPGVTSASDAPVVTNPAVSSPDAPEAPELSPDTPQPSDQSITTNPQQPMAPPVSNEGAFTAPQDGGDVSPSAESDEVPMQQESLLKPSGDLKEKFPQHSSDRLPTVTAQEQADSDPGVAETSPFVQNAVPFEAAGDKPMMAIVLMDDGKPEIDPEALQNFPYPLSIAIDTLAPDVAERVALYQGMGFEILAMIDMPAAAAPSDVEVALGAHLSVMPQAVAVMEGTGDGLQGSKPLSDQVTAVLGSTGHGMLLFQKGLDTARKLASREGVPAASVFRDFDGKGQTASVIRRFLDQAAFKANQEGGVIMVGRLREETLAALLVWGLQDRAGSVALAPVSAVITAKQP